MQKTPHSVSSYDDQSPNAPNRRAASSPAIALSKKKPNMFMRYSDIYVASSASSPAVSQYSTQHYTVKPSISLPVLVNEALSLTENNAANSVRFGENGWTWLLTNTKLLAWKLKQATSKHICKEIILDSGPNKSYHAQLAWIGCSPNCKDQGVISAIVLSAEGYVTFWPNITQSITSAKIHIKRPNSNADDEFLRIVVVKERGYLAVTTNGDMYQLNAVGSSINFVQLHQVSGMLAGIGKRVSSFFFSSDSPINVIDLVLFQSSTNQCDVIILASSSIQRRRISSVSQGTWNEQLLCQFDINDLLMESISQITGDTSRRNIKIWPLDITVSSKKRDLAILVACEDGQTESGTLLRLCVCTFPLSILESGRDISLSYSQIDVVLFDETEVMVNDQDCDTLSYRLLIPKTSNHQLRHAVIWRGDKVIVKSLEKGGRMHEDCLPLESINSILGAGELNMQAVLFESTSGLLSICPIHLTRDMLLAEANTSMTHSPLNTREKTPLPSTPSTSTILRTTIEQMDSDTQQSQQRLQAAFIHFNNMNISQARNIIEETFNGTEGTDLLKDAVVTLSQELIDDYPALDPRWAESLPQGTGNSTSSLILQHQLKDKQKAHQLFLDFLKEVGIWDLLNMPMDNQSKRKSCVQWTLMEHQEKVAAAIALRDKHVDQQGILDSGIRKVIEKRGNFASNDLTPQDVFYRQISQIQDIFQGVMDIEEDVVVDSSLSSREVFSMISGVNEIFEAVLTAVHCLRKSNGVFHEGKGMEFCPWTVTSGLHSLRDALLRQTSIIYTKGIPEADDHQQRAVLHMHSVALTDILLSEYRWQMESLASVPSLSARADEVIESFRRHRSTAIKPILEAGLIEKATVLSEKYQDFDILLEICDRKNDQVMLSKYMKKFENLGFINAFFTWLLERGKFHKLLHYTTSGAITSVDFAQRASEFLSSHPKINWLHQIKTNDLMSAHKTLLYLAMTESDSHEQKNHYVSLSKLAAAFSDEPVSVTDEAIAELNTQEAVLKHQETLPNAVLEDLGVTLDDMPVFSVEKLIKLYVGDNNVRSTQIDFMKALDLLSFIEEDGQADDETADGTATLGITNLKHLIWCKAILKDSWHDIDHGVDPLTACSHTILLKTLDLASQNGVLLQSLPNVDDLLEQESLAVIKNNASSQCLVRLIFQDYTRQVQAS